MADLQTRGIDKLIAALGGLGTIGEEVAEDLLFTSGDILVDHIKKQIVEKDHIDTGSMLKNVTFRRKIKPTKNGNGKYISVLSLKKSGQGKQARQNAYKAFWANYGTKKQKGTRFWSIAVKQSQPQIEAAQEKIIKNFIQEKGLL